MKRNLLVIALLCLGAAACVRQAMVPTTAPSVVMADPALTAENYHKITVGMTLSEVAAVLGPPTSTGGRDVQTPEGTMRKEVEFASWMKIAVPIPVGGDAVIPPEQKRIVVELEGGHVKSKSQVGIK